MYTRLAFTLLFSFAAIGLGIAIPAFPVDERCGPNAHYLECGSACAPTCANPNPGPACTLQCVIGCFCKEGYLKNSQGQCVQPDQCDGQSHPKINQQIPSAAGFPTCPNNEEFQACGSACAPTCANPQPSPLCTKNCVVGCFCKEGHLRNAQGVCVPAHQCQAPQPAMLVAKPPAQCNENEIFLGCGSACAPTCANPNPGPVCTLQCVIGCFCKPGYLKNSQGVCVPASQCDAAPVCAENEEYRQCKGCDGTCDKPNPPCPRICIPGCACKQGHLRSGANGKCIPKEQCPAVTHKCPQNEVFHACGTACPATCANPHPSPVCTKNCVIGCFCQPGFLRNEKGVCVAAANCAASELLAAMLKSEPKCASDRELYVEECGNQLDCAASCHAGPSFLVHGVPQLPAKCLQRNCAASCVCVHPFVRNAQGQCVERKECEPVSQ